MNKNLIILFFTVFLISSCVDDYEEANPPRLLDAPAVNTIELSELTLFGGESTSATIVVSDAPAGIADVSIVDTDVFGVSVGGTTTIVSGLGITSGQVVAEYTAPEGFTGTVNLSIAVLDGQVDTEGNDASKSSVAQDIEIQIFCKQPEPGDYLVTMHDSFGDGWQTTTGGGGPGIQVTLDDGTVLEVTLADGFEGEDTITIPNGTISASWFFPGDFYGE
ncbi:MAG: hypothetical protein RLO81_01500, partial [Fulvivirga sp.]|uniref:hypothetical protein n=1 Tax=Fulvivirga sp. TaxID=1931237 RepID=UPI0032EE7DD1